MTLYEQYAQSEVGILAVYTAVSQAEVHILATYTAVAQVGVHILAEVQVYSQAGAIVQIAVPRYFYDSFSRPASDILGPPFSVGTADTGTPWIWNTWDDHVVESLTPMYVDGSALVLGLLNGTSQTYASMHNIGASIDDGELLIDIWMAAAGDNGAMTYWYDKYWNIQTKNSDNTDDTTFYYRGGSNPTWIAVSNAITTRSAWYRLRVIVNSSSNSEYVKAHIWKIGDTEPVTWTVVQEAQLPADYLNWAYYNALPAMLDVYETPYNEAAKFDNITISGVSYTVYNQGLANAQAKIIIVSNVVSQAEVHILAMDIQVYAQAQVVLNQYWAFAQAGALIQQTYQGFAEAHAILNQSMYVAQAQAIINQGWGIGLAETKIRNYYIKSHGQTGTLIYRVYRVHAAAMGQVGQSKYVGQAQAWTYRTYLRYAQSRTRIYNTDQKYGLAYAMLNQSMYVAQAQAKLNSFDYQQYAQTQALIAIRLTNQLLFLDTFSRPATQAPPFNIGNAETGQLWRYINYSNYNPESLTKAYVDGSAFVLDPIDQYYVYTSVTGPSQILEAGDVYFDIYIPSTRVSGTSYHRVYWYDKQWYFQLQDINSTQYRLRGLTTNTLITPVRDSWYRIHIKVDSLGEGSNQYVKARMWKVGDAEPGTWTTIQTSWPYDATGGSVTDKPIIYIQTPYANYVNGYIYTPSKLDNIQVTGVLYQIINYGSGNATALIQNTYQQYASAHALINQAMGAAQARTHIYRTTHAIGYAEVAIRKSIGLAQAQAVIPYPYTDTYDSMIIEDGATHFYGMHFSNAAYNDEYVVWKDEIGIVNSYFISNYSYSTLVISPVGPEYRGILLNTSSEYVRFIPNTPEFYTPTGGGAYTIETWVQSPPVASVSTTIFEMYGGYSTTYRLLNLGFGHQSTLDGEGSYIRLEIRDSAGNTVYNTGIQYAISTWYHVALTYSSGLIRIYVNGQLTNTVERYTFATATAEPSLYLNYGSQDGNASPTTSRIAYDNLAIYPFPISQDTILEHYNFANPTYRPMGSGQARFYLYNPSGVNIWQQFAQARFYLYNPAGPNRWQTFSQAGTQITANYLKRGQANVRITDAKDQNTHGYAQTAIIPMQGLLKTFVQATTWHYLLPDSGTPEQITYMVADTDPAQINLGNLGDNYGIKWQSWFVADMSGDWYFETRSDDNSAIFIYNEQNQVVGSMLNNWGSTGGQGATNRSGYINLVAGTKYKIDVKYNEGGSSAEISAWYRRPGGTTNMYLLAGEAPWNDKSRLPTVRYWGMGLANALWVERNGDWYVWPNYAQAQARVYYPALKGYAQAQTQVGAYWYAQAIAQIAYAPATTDYRATVLADKPILYYPMDEQPTNNLVRLAGSTYTASDYYSGSYTPAMAADGIYTDGWASSGWTAGDGEHLTPGTWWNIEWFSPQTFNYVRLTNRPDYTMGYGRIILSDGTNTTTYRVTFPQSDKEVKVYPVVANNIIWMRIISDGGGNTHPGFSEIEVFVDNPDNTILHTIVGRRNATWNYPWGPTRNEPSAIITGTSIDFNGNAASDQGQIMRYAGGSTAPLTIPGYQRGENIISPVWWGVAGDQVTVYIGTAPASSDVGISSYTTNENQWWSRGGPQTTSGLDSNTQYTFTLTTTGIHWVYLWQYNAGYTGTGTVTIPGSFIAQDPSYGFKTAGSVITVEAWVKWSGTTDYQMIFGFHEYNFSVLNGNLVIEVPNNQWYGTSNIPIVAGQWYHVAAIMYNQQAFSTNTRIYINGVQQSLSGSGTATGMFQEWFSIGGWTANGSYRFQGHIDEFAIYNYALTTEQIQAHYRSVKRQVYAQANAWIRGRYSVHAGAQVFGGRQADGWYHDFKYFGAAATIVIVHDNLVVSQAGALIQGEYGLVRMTWNNAAHVVGDIFNWGDTEWEQGHLNYYGNEQSVGVLPSSYPGYSNWGMAWSGNFIADADGLWQFRTTSDDGSDLWIGGTRVVDNQFGSPHGTDADVGSINLVAGNFYTIHTRFGQGGGPWRMTVEYKRPLDSVWYYLNDNNPPWIRTYWGHGGFAQATAQILPVPKKFVHGYAEAKLNSFGWMERGQAQADILQTYRVYGQAHAVLNRGWGLAQSKTTIIYKYNRVAQSQTIVNQYLRLAQAQAKLNAFGVKGFASTKVHIKAYGIQKYGQAKAQITYTQRWHGLAAVSIKQTYPLSYINPNYSLATLGTTVLPDPNFSMEETVPESVLDGNITSVWTNFLAIDVNENQYFYLNLDLGTYRTISSYYILPFKYNVTANLQYNTRGSIDLSDSLTKDDAAWTDIATNIYFDVHITDPISYADAIFREIPPTTARYWRLKFTSGGDDNKVSIATFQLGVSTTVGAFAQAMASFGHFGVAQAMSYTSPGLSTWHGQTRTHIKTTSNRYAQAQTWYLPPTSHGLARTSIYRTYSVQGNAMVWALPPTVFGLSEVHITTIYSVYGLGLTDIKTTYRKYGLARAFIDKFVEIAQAQALIYHRSMYSGNARVFIGHFASGMAAAYIVKSKAYGQALAGIKQDYTKYGQARVFIHRLEVFSQGMALIYRTYSKHGLALTVLNQYWQFGLALTTSVGTYARVAQAKVKIRAIVNPFAYANSYIKTRNPNYAQAQAFIWKRSTVSAQAMTQVGAFWYANAQARIIAFDVPKTAQAAGYILVDINVLPTTPASNLQSYLVMYNNHTLPGYAQSEFMSSVARLFTAKGAYIDSSIVDYLGLENKEITLKMLVWEPTYLECKIRVQEAATLLRSKRKAYNKLYLQYFNKYYEAMPKSISTDKVVGTSVQRLEYEVTFEARPWLISNDIYTLTGTGTVETTGRTLLDGGWTPTVIIVSGTDITVSGITEYGESTGSIEIAGTVSNYVIDTENFETSDNALITPKDYGIYVGPGITTFTITGATDCRIEYHNRWYI